MKYLIITVLLIFTLGMAQDVVAPQTVPLKQYNDLVKKYNTLQAASDSYIKRMVVAQDANTDLRQTIGNLASDLLELGLAPVDSVLAVYGIARI